MGKKNNSLKHVEHILFLLDGIKHTRDERKKILKSFMNVKISKITEKKVLNKLQYLRQIEKRKYWEKKLNIIFGNSLRIEFYREFEFHFQDNLIVQKELFLESDVVEESIFDMNSDDILDYLNRLIEEAISKKDKEVRRFVDYAKDNPYLSINEIYSILLISMPPDKDIFTLPIPYPTLKALIRSDYQVKVTKKNISISKNFNYLLYDKQLQYIVTAIYERSSIYKKIWEHKSLNIENSLSSIVSNFEDNFRKEINILEEELLTLDKNIDIEIVKKHIYKYIEDYVSSQQVLTLPEKLKRRVKYHFQEELRAIQIRKKKQELLAKSIRDFKSLFPLARALNRKIVFHVGPTNSGKTHKALEKLKSADSGYYLAPLRLLALEGYEALLKSGIGASLITGEEEIIDEESTHIASTIEMMNSDVEVDIAVIDEVQMVADRDRGWAWANAIIGVPAKEVILTGSSNALEAIKKLCEYLNEPFEIVEFDRKNELKILPKPTKLKYLDKKSAIVAFSRRDVLNLKGQLAKRYKVSVIYGNLSPEVRREEARRFRDGESDILIATDAISMGLNLPIKTLIFAKHTKFDGFNTRELTVSEVTQIAGRAGRFGLNEVGYIGALDKDTLKVVRSKLKSKLEQIELPFSVMATLEHTLLIGDILQTDNIFNILQFFADNMEFEGPFRTANITSMLEVASIVSKYNLDLKTKYFLSCSPAQISSPYIEGVFNSYLRKLEKGLSIDYNPPKDLPKYAKTNGELLKAEDRVREITLYLWLSFKFPDSFPDIKLALETRVRLNSFIEESLKRANFVRRCNRCNRVLDFKNSFSICDKCFAKIKRGYR